MKFSAPKSITEIVDRQQKQKKPISVKQSNELINAGYKLSLNAKRLLILALGKINGHETLWKKGEHAVEITAADWQEHFANDSKNVYQQMKQAIDDLYNADVVVLDEVDRGRNFRWISEKEYHTGEGWVRITLTKPVLLHTSTFIDAYTSYKLLSVGGLRSVHSIRTYELLQQFQKTGFRYIELDEYKKALGIDKNAYQVFADLRKRVIEHALKEINEKSDFNVTYDLKKRGRKIHAIRFFMSKKKQRDLFEKIQEGALDAL